MEPHINSFYRFYDNSFKLSVNEPPIYKDRLLWNIDPVFVFFESTVSRTICKHFASGTFILRIENWKASPTVPITVNTTAGIYSLPIFFNVGK